MSSAFTIYPNLLSITDSFNGILLDAYGVFWGGNAKGLLKNSQETMKRLVKSGKIVGILSNTTQLVDSEIQKLEKTGLLQNKHFHFLVTSGQITKEILKKGDLPFPITHKKYWVLGRSHPKFSSHKALFSDTYFTETENITDADFIYVSIPHKNGKDQINPELFKADVEKLCYSYLPMVCPNPDQFAHEGNPPKLVVRQGTLAKFYEELGGNVFYVGKPSSEAFAYAMHQFNAHDLYDAKDILMVGDTPETDIRGAKYFGMKSALVTQTGIMGDKVQNFGFEQTIRKFPHTDFPDFFIEKLSL